MAIQASYVNRHIDWSNLRFTSQFGERGFCESLPGEPIPRTPISKNYADFSTGIVGYSENFFVGFAVHHLTRPDEAFTSSIARIPMKFTAHAGANLDLKRQRGRFRDPKMPTISPNIIYQQQGTAHQINYGVYFNNVVQSLVFGVWYRQTIAFNQPESVTFLVGMRQNSLRVGYSYDLSVNKLYRVSGGSHELSMAYLLPCRAPKVRIKKINCPSF
jgi:type IX secretion system PorP/SprF family membrane protein